METRKRPKKLDIALVILVVMVLLAIAATLWRGGYQLTIHGFRQVGQLINTVWLRLLLGLTLSGLIQVLIPRSLIAKWLGPASRLKGILVASYVGIFMTGGPPVRLPIVASIYRAGAGVGPTIALMTGAGLLGLHGFIVWQIPFLGAGIPLSRYIVCLFVPPLVGLAGGAIFRVVTRSPQLTAKGDSQNTVDAGQQPETTDETRGTAEKESEEESWT